MSNTQGARRGSIDETIAPRGDSRRIEETIAPAASAKPASDVTVAPSDTARRAPDETIAPADTSQQPPATIDSLPVPHGLDVTIDSIPGLSLARRGDSAAAAPRPQVAGYTILSELGRGGMGVVYKAKQKKLNRIVALKMVLAGAHAGQEQLARFYTEAEAVAHLQHKNIVQIHEVGEHDGLPYFSLEYVDGGSLSERIDGKPQPVEETGRMVEKLARAMAYAHQQGIVHRDLKPANVLVAKDGEPKITDFGLAKRLESDSSQTKSGTLMGTPNYMAPEQARGEIRDVGPLADVYALGVILYEMLTGRTPFLGSSILDTLQQIRNQEPVPPSRLQPKVPRDLETICLKCLQKEPVKRYESAEALAGDLARFVAGEPILARPVAWPERSWRWCQRNPRIAALSAAVLLLLISLAVGGPVAAILVSQQKALAEKNEKAAREAQTAAENSRALAERRKEEAEAARLVADENSKIAGEQAGLALTTIQTLIDKVQKQLQDAPQTQQLKKELLQTAMDGLKQVSQRAEGSTTIEATMANAHMKMGLIFRQLGETEEAFKQFMRCHDITQRRAAAKPESDAAKSNVAATLTVLGDMSQDMRRDMEGALDYYVQAMKLREELHHSPRGGEGKVDPVAVTKALAETYAKVGLVQLRLGDAEKTFGHYHSSLKLRQELAEAAPNDAVAQQNLARSFGSIGDLSFRLKKLETAREFHAKALEVREALFKAAPNNRLKQEMAGSHGMLGEIALRSGDLNAAQQPYQISLKLCRELLESDPKNVNYQRDLGVAYYRAGTLARRLEDEDTSLEHFRECLALREKMASADPTNDRRRMELMVVLPHCGQHEQAAEMADRLRASGALDSELLMEMACCYAQCAEAANSSAELRQAYADKAIAAISDAAAQGHKDVVVLETDPDLEPIRNQPAFQVIVEKVKQLASGAESPSPK